MPPPAKLMRNGARARIIPLPVTELLPCDRRQPWERRQVRARTGVHGRRAEGDVGPVPAGIAGALGEQRDAERVLARSLPGDPRRIGARGDVHPGRGDREERVGDVRRDAARRRASPAPRARPRPRSRLHAHAGATRVLAAGGVEQDPLGAGLEPGPGAAITTSGSSPRPDLQRLPDGPPGLADDRYRLVAAQLDGVGVDGGDDGAEGVRTKSAVTMTMRGLAAPAAAEARARRASAVPSSIDSSRGVPGAKLSPMASAPARTAARIPASSVTPQIFTNGGARVGR